MSNYNVAVVGATGAVGEAMLEILEQRDFPVNELFPLASERSAGKTVMYKNKPVTVGNLADFDFSRAQIGLFSAGGSVSAEFAPKAGEAGCIVIDNTSHFRYDEDIPLVVPEVNSHKIAEYKTRNIIANPNCSTIQMLVALKPIYDAVGIKRISVATYQAVSGTGKAAVEELAKQTAELLNGREAEYEVYPRQIAFNALPHIDAFMDNGYTKEEMKMNWETRKIFGDEEIQVSATCVRIPVFFGHSEAVQIETRNPISDQEVRDLLENAAGVTVIDERTDGGYPTEVEYSAG
ncbi:MAG: aspartate-semialdehyde dehydrogenase [Gammaproteobacteria bacterium]|nr:aspartate-semialdehyde dehydrogenase [Gammaproteobacteria bacterium]